MAQGGKEVFKKSWRYNLFNLFLMLTLIVVVPQQPKVPGDYTTHECWEIDCARFEGLKGEDWYINQEVEPDTHDGKSVLTQWLDVVEKDGIRHVECCVPLVDQADDWCRKPFPRLDRAVVHVRNHLGHKPYLCGGYPNCEQEGWYVKELVTCR